MIQGQITHLSRTTHGIAYDSAHDEMWRQSAGRRGRRLPRRGDGRRGADPHDPGRQTGLSRPETVAVDEKNDELFSATPAIDACSCSGGTRTATPSRCGRYKVPGRAAPDGRRRRRSRPRPARRVEYSRLPGGVTGLFIFGRTDEGDVPRADRGREPASCGCGRSPSTRDRQDLRGRHQQRIPAPYSVDKPRAASIPTPICRRPGTRARKGSSAYGTRNRRR